MDEKLVLNISGMSCKHCEQSVYNALKNRSGVSKVDVNLEEKKAYLQYDPKKTTVNELIETVKEAGYIASVK